VCEPRPKLSLTRELKCVKLCPKLSLGVWKVCVKPSQTESDKGGEGVCETASQTESGQGSVKLCVCVPN
jgi:hypothetical protein